MYKGCKSNWSITKRFLMNKLWNDIVHRFRNFSRAEKRWFFGHRHSLLMDLGQDQQQHPTVHSAGVSRVPLLFPSDHHPLPCCSPFAPLRNLITWLGNWEILPFSTVTTVFSHFQPFSTIFGHVQLFLTIAHVFNYFHLFSAVFSSFQPFSAVFSHFWPFSPVFIRCQCF